MMQGSEPETHDAAFGADASDDRIWTILCRLQILVFDFSAEHGQTESLVRERSTQALDSSDRGRAGALWSALCDIAQSIAASGGEIEFLAIGNCILRKDQQNPGLAKDYKSAFEPD
jgi:hypothetical protein